MNSHVHTARTACVNFGNDSIEIVVVVSLFALALLAPAHAFSSSLVTSALLRLLVLLPDARRNGPRDEFDEPEEPPNVQVYPSERYRLSSHCTAG